AAVRAGGHRREDAAAGFRRPRRADRAGEPGHPRGPDPGPAGDARRQVPRLGERGRPVAVGQPDQLMSEQPTVGTHVAEVVGLSKRFGATVALDSVDVAVAPGEVHALVGRNGAGKSTLVSILTGLAVPDGGTVRFGGEPAPPLGDREAWRQVVACVYQKL